MTRTAFIGSILLILSRVLSSTVLPILADDVAKITNSWARDTRVNAFKDLYQVSAHTQKRILGLPANHHSNFQLSFVMSLRLTTCKDFPEDPKKVKNLIHIFKRLEEGSTPSAIILPWIPTPARVRRFVAGAKLYMMFNEVVEVRKREGRREDDPLQTLIDKNHNVTEITRVGLSFSMYTSPYADEPTLLSRSCSKTATSYESIWFSHKLGLFHRLDPRLP